MHLVGIACLIVSMGVTWMLTPAVCRLARATGALDLPSGRKIHVAPIPRMGGLAVFAGFLAGLTFAAWATGALGSAPETGVYWRGLAIAATAMLLVGLADDLWGLSFVKKFAAQIAAAWFVWSCGFRIEVLSHPLGGEIDLGLLSFPVTMLWIVGITNAVNLIDGLDGLATGIALISTTTLAAIALARSELGVAAASVALAGSLLGFLRFNFNPARIFLGDSGSMFLGFVLAVTSVRGSQKGTTAVAVLVPLLALGLPLLDTGLTIVRRLYRIGSHGLKSDASSLSYIVRNLRGVFLPDREHIHHRLIEMGLSQRRAVVVLYGVGVVFATCAFLMVLVKSAWIAVLLMAVLGLSMAGFFMFLYPRVWRLRGAGQRAEPVPTAGEAVQPRTPLAAAPRTPTQVR